MLMVYLILVQLTTGVIMPDATVRLVINIVLLVIGTIYLLDSGLIHLARE